MPAPHGIVYLKHIGLFTYDNEISPPVSTEDLPFIVVNSNGFIILQI